MVLTNRSFSDIVTKMFTRYILNYINTLERLLFLGATFLWCDIVKQCLRNAWSYLQEKSQGLHTNLCDFPQSFLKWLYTEGLCLYRFPQFGQMKSPFLFIITGGREPWPKNKNIAIRICKKIELKYKYDSRGRFLEPKPKNYLE